jgi:hypothetical protein
MQSFELDHSRHQPLRREAVQRRQGKLLGSVFADTHGLDRQVDTVDVLSNRQKQSAPGCCQIQPGGRSLEEFNPQVVFEPCDLLADSTLADMQN